MWKKTFQSDMCRRGLACTYIVYGKSAAESTGKIKKVSGELKIFEFPVTKRAAARHFAFRIDNMLPYYAGSFVRIADLFSFAGFTLAKR